MQSLIENKTMPINTKAKEFIKSIDFFDSFTVYIPKDEDIKELYIKGLVFSPKWVEYLLRLRNKIVKLFGLITVDTISKEYDFTVGKKVGMFTLYHIQESEIITGEKDSHLDFCLSFLKEDKKLTITTLVSYNNFFGKLYFFFVKPFHKLIVKSMMKKYLD